MAVFLILFFSITIGFSIYFEKVIAKRIPVSRKQKIYELLKNDFKELKENNLGFFECDIDGKKILFEYIVTRYKFNFSNYLYLYLDITNLEEDIKKLCKIHFYCSNIDNRDWVKMEVTVLFSTVDILAKHSKKTVNELISETSIYILQKRVEQTKKIIISSQ